MIKEPQLRKLESSFVGAPPMRRIERATGVSGLGFDARSSVYSSFQPFLEALHGHEVISLESRDLVQEG